jgi:hypothetical protein
MGDRSGFARASTGKDDNWTNYTFRCSTLLFI